MWLFVCHLLCAASSFSINACKFMIAQVILKSDEVLIAIGYSGLSAVWCGVNALAVPRRDVIGRACVVDALNYGDGTGPVYCVAFWLQTGQNILKHFENININTNIIVNHQGPDNLLIAVWKSDSFALSLVIIARNYDVWRRLWHHQIAAMSCVYRAEWRIFLWRILALIVQNMQNRKHKNALGEDQDCILAGFLAANERAQSDC